MGEGIRREREKRALSLCVAPSALTLRLKFVMTHQGLCSPQPKYRCALAAVITGRRENGYASWA